MGVEILEQVDTPRIDQKKSNNKYVRGCPPFGGAEVSTKTQYDKINSLQIQIYDLQQRTLLLSTPLPSGRRSFKLSKPHQLDNRTNLTLDEWVHKI